MENYDRRMNGNDWQQFMGDSNPEDYMFDNGDIERNIHDALAAMYAEEFTTEEISLIAANLAEYASAELESDNDDDDDPEEVERYTLDDDTYIIIRNGDEYEVDTEWSDGPAAVFKHLPSETEVAEVHEAAMRAFEEIDADHRYESAILDELEQIMTAAEVAAEFGITERNVRKTCKDGRVKARKSGATWLISRADARRQWGKRN